MLSDEQRAQQIDLLRTIQRAMRSINDTEHPVELSAPRKLHNALMWLTGLVTRELLDENDGQCRGLTLRHVPPTPGATRPPVLDPSADPAKQLADALRARRALHATPRPRPGGRASP